MTGVQTCALPILVVTFLGSILLLLAPESRSFAQSADDHRVWIQALDNLSGERMLADVTTLSGPSFNGRQTGTADDASSAQWVANRFRASGLLLANIRNDPSNPLGQGRRGATGFMSTMVTAPKIAPDPILRIATAGAPLTKQQIGRAHV